MGVAPLAPWLLEQEARALLTRLDRVKPFVLQETMVPAAALSPAAQLGIERYLMTGRRQLRGHVAEFIRWIRGVGRRADPAEMQRRFTFLRLRFNTALAQFDLFSEVVTQRSEHEVGVWLSGLDVAAQDALTLPGTFFASPPIICHLSRGLGGAIRRAHTRLPGGGSSPVAVIRIPRERMIGYGIASSLVHEVGHQAAALLGLVESLRPALQRQQQAAPPQLRSAWHLYERWVSEIVADFWAVAKVGVSSTFGLIGIVSLPRAFVFRVNADDPHPAPWVRVLISTSIGNALYPDPMWSKVAGVWASLYPTTGLDPTRTALIRSFQATMPTFVRTLLDHRPPSLRGRPLGPTVRVPDRTPRRLANYYRSFTESRDAMRRASPSLVFAALGQARANGLISPEKEARILGEQITYWAMKSTLEGLQPVSGSARWKPSPDPLGARSAPELIRTELAAQR
jgi:hypothetical protein